MELSLVASVELARRQETGKAPILSTVRCSAFHPSEPNLFVAVEDDIYMTDALQGQIMARFAINSGQVVNLFPCRGEPYLGALVALEEEFLVYVWNLHQLAIKAVYPIKHVTTKKPAFWAITNEAKLLYTQQGSKTIHILDWKDGSSKKIESPKPINNMFLHPLKPQLGTILSDGTIRVINVLTNTATMWNEGAAAEKDKPTLLTFHPAQPYMVALLMSGTLVCWDMSATKDACLGSIKAAPSDKETIEHVIFHGTLPFLLTVNSSGIITTWNFFARKKHWIVKIISNYGQWQISPAQIELANRYGHLPNFATKLGSELVVLTDVRAHPTYNFFTFNFRMVGKANTDIFHLQHLLDTLRIGVYSLRLFDEQTCNMVIPQQQSLLFWASPEKEIRIRTTTTNKSSSTTTSATAIPKKDSMSAGIGLTPRETVVETKEMTNVFYFSNESFLLDDLNLLAYSPAYNDISLAKKLPATDFEGLLLRPTRLVRSYLTDRFLVFFLRQDAEKDITTFGVSVVCRDAATKDMTVSPAAGQAGIFFGADDEFLVLSENGMQVEVWKNEEETTLPMVYELPSPMVDVFWTPMEGGNIILFSDLQRWRLIASFKNHISGSKFMLNSQHALQLQPGEEAIQVLWHRLDLEDTPLLAAVLTTRRVLIVNEKLQIVASAQQVASSCLWLGAALLFNTKSHLQFLTVRNAVYPLISLRLPDAILVTLLNDRVALAVRRAGESSIVTNAVGLLEPLVLGFLHYFEAELQDLDRKQRTKILLDCAESYDARRVSWQLVEEVTKHGYREFALQLLIANSHLLSAHHQFAFELALTTHHYSTAFTLIERSSLLKTAPNLFRLQRAALKLGQFDVARKCAEATSDWTTLIYIYTLAKSKEGLLLLKKELERDKDANAGILALLDRQLQHPDIASKVVKPESIPINPVITPLATSEAQKLLARQDSGIMPKLAKNFSYNAQPVLKNMTYATNKRWKVEPHAQVPCEMRTLPLEGGSGNLVVGPLLLNTLLGDWFTRQVPYFELPEALRGDSAAREVILRLLSEKQNESKSSASAPGSATSRQGRTLTIGGGPAPVPALALSSLGNPTGNTPATASSHPHPATAHAPSTTTKSSTTKDQHGSAPAPSLHASGSMTSRGNLMNPPASAGPAGDQRSPRKLASATTMRPMSTVAANLMNAIANSGSKDSKSSGSSPSQGLSTDDSLSTSDSDAVSPAGSSALGTSGQLSKSGSASNSDLNTTQILALAEQALTTDPIVLFQSALSKLEHADFDACILDLNSVLLALVATNGPLGDAPSSESLLRQQVQMCVRYKLTCVLLCEMRKLEEAGTKAVQVAHLAQFLADIPVMPRHRAVLLRMAMKKNLIVQNYGFAAKCLNMLIPKDMPDKASLEKQLEDCKTKNLKDTEPLALGTKLCFRSFAPRFITTKQSSVACKLCHASYHPNMMSLAAPCAFCFWRGNLTTVPPYNSTISASAPVASQGSPSSSSSSSSSSSTSVSATTAAPSVKSSGAIARGGSSPPTSAAKLANAPVASASASSAPASASPAPSALPNGLSGGIGFVISKELSS